MSVLIPLYLIDPNPYQPRDREDPEHVKKIAHSIAEQGLLQTPVARAIDRAGDLVYLHGPITAEEIEDAGYRIQLAFGHTRLAAYKWLHETDELAGKESDWTRMPVELRNLEDQQMFEMGISENLARKDLSPLEEAKAMKRYRDEFGKTSAEIGSLFGDLAESTIRNKIRLLNLPEDVLAKLAEGTMLEGAARELLALYEIPEDIRKRASDAWWYTNDDSGKPSGIIRQAAAGASAEWVSGKIDDIIKKNMQSLSEAPWKHEWIVADPFYGPQTFGPCKGCLHRLTRKGTPYCAKAECYKAKEAAWEREYLVKASQACGIPVLEVNVSNPTHLGSYEDPGGKIKSGKCQNLRLDYHEDAKLIPNWPHAEIVCVKQNKQCACAKGLQAVEKQVRQDHVPYKEQREKIAEVADALTPDQLADQARAARRSKQMSMSQVAGIQKRADDKLYFELEIGSPAGWLMILEVLSSIQVSKLIREGRSQDIPEIQKEIADEVIRRMMPGSMMLEGDSDPAGYALRQLNEKFKECGMSTLTRMDFENVPTELDRQNDTLITDF